MNEEDDMPEETRKFLDELEKEKDTLTKDEENEETEEDEESDDEEEEEPQKKVVELAGVQNIDNLDQAEEDQKIFQKEKKQELEKIEAKELINVEISPEMKQAYLDYAMSVIIGRALPNAEDGLKPVHRRILWAMHQMGLESNKQTKKSARIVGDTMGKYHPHGDSAIYESMVRMGQSWVMRYPLVLGQGNFGSMDGDGAAAMRYTEAKMQKISDEMMEEIEKDTVDMRMNFDNTLEEPVLMPAKIPNLLLNGSNGIAVGMATNIPTHNLTNVCDTILYYIDNPTCEIKELISRIKGPDFPTGGSISGQIKQMYETGKGKIIIDGKTEIEEPKKKTDKLKIVIVEVPYQVNKSELVQQIANLVRDKKLPDVADIRDESSKGKIRIVIEMRRDTEPKFTINRLYKYTNLRINFSANMLALVGQKPKLLNLKQIVGVYVTHRKKVIRRAKEFDLDKAKKRIHIVEGLLVAQKNIDEVIRMIKASQSRVEANAALMTKFELTQKQVDAILDMKLSSLTSLEVDKLKTEAGDLEKLILHLQKILGDEQEILNLIKGDLVYLKEKYGDKRKTKIIGEVEELAEKDLVDKKDVVITITEKGYIKRIDVDEYKEQKRGGKGVIGSELGEDDFVQELISCSTHDYLLFFTNKGKIHWLKAHEVPMSSKNSKGRAIINVLDIKDENIASVIAVKKFENYLMMVTEKGIVKKIELSAFNSPRKGGIKAIKLAETNDTLIDVKIIKDKQELLLVTQDGQAIRFNSDEVRCMGRASYGVTGIKLNPKDKVVSLEVLPLENQEKYAILTITKNGYGKRSEIEDYRLTGRAGKGVINMKTTDKTGEIVNSTSVTDEDSVVVTTKKGIVIRMSLENIRIMGRATQGVRIINLASDDEVGDITRLPKDDIKVDEQQQQLT